MVCGDKVLVLTVGAGVLLVDVPPAVSAVKHGLATDRRMGKSFSIRLSVTMLARWLRMPAVSAVNMVEWLNGCLSLITTMLSLLAPSLSPLTRGSVWFLLGVIATVLRGEQYAMRPSVEAVRKVLLLMLPKKFHMVSDS